MKVAWNLYLRKPTHLCVCVHTCVPITRNKYVQESETKQQLAADSNKLENI